MPIPGFCPILSMAPDWLGAKWLTSLKKTHTQGTDIFLFDGRPVQHPKVFGMFCGGTVFRMFRALQGSPARLGGALKRDLSRKIASQKQIWKLKESPERNTHCFWEDTCRVYWVSPVCRGRNKHALFGLACWRICSSEARGAAAR